MPELVEQLQAVGAQTRSVLREHPLTSRTRRQAAHLDVVAELADH